MKKRISPRVSLIIIAAMFVLPLLAAWFMYSGAIAYKPAATRNFGTLVEPPLPLAWEDTHLLAGSSEDSSLAEDVFYEHWVVLYPVTGGCDETCLRDVTALRQIHRASGRHQSRILIALLIQQPGDPQVQGTLQNIYPTFHLINDPSGQTAAVLEQIQGNQAAVYLIDPLGNIMMTYDAGADPNHLKQDLKRLLTWSKLDEQS